MTTELKLLEGGAIQQWQPDEAADHQAKLAAIIQYAAKLRDWPLVEQAVDAKIEDQRRFVAWWDGAVGPAGRRWPNVIVSDPIQLSAGDAEARSGITKLQVSRWRAVLADPAGYRSDLLEAIYRKAGLEPGHNFRAIGTGDNEWSTPPQYIEAARRTLGEIDLDPASNLKAQEWIQARQFFTVEDDGLVPRIIPE